MKDWLITLLIGFFIYEILEHIIFPLYWMIRYGRRKSVCGPSGMIGKKCVVRQWDGAKGKVWVSGELWNASSRSQLIPGDEAVVQGIDGLTLHVSAPERLRTPEWEV